MTNLKLKKVSKRNRLIYFDDIPRGVIPAAKLPVLPHAFDENEFLETEIEPEKADEIKKIIDNHAWNRILDWLAMQERSSHECMMYLKKIFIPEEVADIFVNKLKKLNYVNDERFAELYISSLADRGRSRLEIKNKLYEKTSDIGNTEAWIEEYFNFEQEKTNLRMNIEKLLNRWQKLSDDDKKEKIISNLTRHGFSFQMIRDELAKMEIEYEDYNS